MKLKFLTTALIVSTAVFLTGCGATTLTREFAPPGGFIVTSTKMPLTTRFDNTPVKQDKGTASTMYFKDPLLTGLDFAWEDCSIEKAAKNGGLETVEYADLEIFHVLWIFGKATVTAYGDKKSSEK